MDPWHPVDDGILPIVDALRWFSLRELQSLPVDVSFVSTCPSSELKHRLNDRQNRVEILRRWLQFNGHLADSGELVNRLDAVLSELRTWEMQARTAIHDNAIAVEDKQEVGEYITLRDQFGNDICERFDEIRDNADATVDYLRQLAVMLNARISTRQNRNDPPPPMTDELRTLTEREQRVINAVRRSPGMKGEQLANCIDLEYGGSTKELFAQMVKRGFLTSGRKTGYRLGPKSVESQNRVRD